MDSTMEIFTLKDAFWKLSTRVAVIENFISEKFGATAFSVVHKQLSMANSSSNMNTMEENLSQPQISNLKPEVIDSKMKSESVSKIRAANKRNSNAESNTELNGTTVKKRRRVSQPKNYNEDDDEDSEEESTSSDFSKAQFDTPPDLDSTVQTIKIEDDDADYNPNEDDDYPELSPNNSEEDEDSKPSTQSRNIKDEKCVPKPKSKYSKNNESSKDAEKKTSTNSFTEQEVAESLGATKQRRMSYKWKHGQEFPNIQAAIDHVKADKLWKYRVKKRLGDCTKIYYDCKHSRKCLAKIYLHLNKSDSHVQYFKTAHKHSHTHKEVTKVGLCDEVKLIINDLLQKHVKRPIDILTALEDHDVLQPTRMQVNNYLSYKRMKEAIPDLKESSQKMCEDQQNKDIS